ncbi:MAG: hypothetical protein BMS9Abin39_0532 [Ignavibacteria bacterium]|nr:MAG: hypothetical protein BMS9Abin39_0532 [Ignavibacteria bacterium]
MKLKILITFILFFILSFSLMAQKKETTHKFLLSGYSFTNLEIEGDKAAQFEIGFNPIFLWSIRKNMLFEGELEFELEDNSTNVALEYAQFLYIANAYITFGVGKFLSPNNIFAERYHPAWMNKLPNMPLGLSGHGGVQLVSGTQVGVQIRGGISAGSSRIVYALYVSNGPTLNIDEGDTLGGNLQKINAPTDEGGEGGHGPGATGTLAFHNIPDNNSNKAIGGRIGFVPFPELEIGYGFETARVGTDDTKYSDVRSLNNILDLSYVQDIKSIAGRVDVKSQVTFLNVDNQGTGLLNYENNSTAWYAQLAYQPYYIKNSFLKNLEVVARYEQIDLPKEAELNTDKNRITVGLNYWINHSTVIKFSYGSITSEHEDEDETESLYVFQVAMGF